MAERECLSVEEVFKALEADGDFDEPFADGSYEEFECLKDGKENLVNKCLNIILIIYCMF